MGIACNPAKNRRWKGGRSWPYIDFAAGQGLDELVLGIGRDPRNDLINLHGGVGVRESQRRLPNST